MKKVLIGLGAVVVLVIVAILVGPSFYDWNSLKPDIAAQAKKLTGRDLAIDGDISLAILPSPRLQAEKVRFANIEGGSVPDMATLDALAVHVALVPLLSGEVQVESVSLVRPTIVLERLADGRVNWQVAGTETDAAAPAGQTDSGAAMDVRLDRLEIEDGTLIYRDAASETEQLLTVMRASVSAESLQGPFHAAGSLGTNGIPLDFEASTGRLAPGQPVPILLRLSVPETEAKASFGGNLRVADEGTSFSGKVQVEGQSLAKLLAVISPGAVLPAQLADNFAIEGAVEYAEPFADLKDVTLRLGDTMATGGVTVDTGTPLFAKATFKLNRLDLDTLLAAEAGPADSSGDATAPASDVAPLPGEAAFALPTGIGAELELSVDAIGYRGGVISDARLSATLADGEITLTRASALLPGGSDIAIAGTIDAEAGRPRFAGAIEASSDNLRGFLDWLQVPLPAGVAPDRLRKLSMTSRITATPAAAQIADIDLRFDASRVTGGIAIALPEAGRRVKPGFGIGLAIDKLNLDGYLGGAAATETAPGATAAEEPASAPSASAGGLPLDVLRPLADFDANVELRVGSLTFHDQTMQGLHLDGTLQTGNLTLRDLSVQEFAGGRGALSGNLTDLAGDPRFETTFDLAAGDTSRVLQFAGIDFPGRAKLGRLKLNGTLAGGRDDLSYDAAFSFSGIGAEGRAQGRAVGFSAGIPRVDTDLSVTAKDAGPLLELAGLAGATDAKLGSLSLTGKAASGADDLTYDLAVTLSGVGGDAKLAGKITEISSATPQVDTRLDISAEKPAGLLRLAGLDADAAGKLGALGVSGTLAGGTDALSLDLALTGLGGNAKVNGTVAAAAAPATFDLAVQADHPELRQLLVAFADYRPAAETLGPLHVAAKAAGSTDKTNLTDLVLAVGDSRLTGTALYETGPQRPHVAATLSGNVIDLSGFSAAGGGRGGAGGGGGSGERWSREPLDLSALDAVDADVDLTADAVVLDDTRIDDLKAKLSLKDGILTITNLTGNAYGGMIDIKGQLAGRGVPSASGTVVATNVDSGQLIAAGLLDGRITGPVTVSADLKTLGVSMADMVNGLNGTGNVAGTITVLTTTEQQIGSALLNILGTKVKEVKGLTDTIDAVFSAFAGAANTLTGDFVVRDGVLDTRNTQLENAKARLLAQGQADLAGWTMDMAASIFRLPADSPYLTVDLDGALDGPNARFTGGEFSGGTGGAGGLLQQVVPGLTGQGSGTGTADQPESGLGGVLRQVIPGSNREQSSPQTTPQATAPSAEGATEPEAAGSTAPAPAPEAPAAETPPAQAETSPEAPPEPTPTAEPEPTVPAASPAPEAEETGPAPDEAAPAEAPAAAPEPVEPDAAPEPVAPAAESETAPESAAPAPEPEAAPEPAPLEQQSPAEEAPEASETDTPAMPQQEPEAAPVDASGEPGAGAPAPEAEQPAEPSPEG